MSRFAVLVREPLRRFSFATEDFSFVPPTPLFSDCLSLPFHLRKESRDGKGFSMAIVRMETLVCCVLAPVNRNSLASCGRALANLNSLRLAGVVRV